MSDVEGAKRRAAERALATGGVPLEPYPGYLAWFVRQCVERGAASGLDWLCRVFPEREEAILARWCPLACAPGHLWAWREARARLERLVVGGEAIPCALARFAIEPPPAPARGPAPQGARAVLIEGMMCVLESEALDAHEVNEQFGAAFPSERLDPGTTLRKRRAKARAWVAPAFEAGAHTESVPSCPSRARVLDVDWGDPLEACVALLLSRWPAFALLWALFPRHRDAHLEVWCRCAGRDAWVWDEVRALLDHAIYCGWSLPPRLRAFVAVPRPANPPGRPRDYGRWVRVGAIEARCAEVVRSPRAAQYFVEAAFERVRTAGEHVVSPDLRLALGLDLDPSRVRRNFISGREQLRGVSAYTLE